MKSTWIYRGELLYEKDGVLIKILKKKLRGTKILICGPKFKLFSPLTGTNSKMTHLFI